MPHIGIYKITNTINNHSYIGQSRNITKRWRSHKESSQDCTSDSYDYPLQRAFRKYGIDLFDFNIIEECSIEQLNEREAYWIDYFRPEYNQTIGQNYTTAPQKLSYIQVCEIQQILLNDINGLVSHKELANTYGVHKDTIRDINVGRTWYNNDYTYPLHYSKFDAKNPKIKKYFCENCGIEISKGSTKCLQCQALQRRKVSRRPSREELKQLIRTTPFTKIGLQFGVSDNTIRKWCDAENLPRKASDIKRYSDKEWLEL